MLKRLGMRLAVSVVGGAAFAAWIAACSGSDQQDVVTPTPDATPEAALPDTFTPDVQNDVVLDVVKDTGPIYDAGPAASPRPQRPLSPLGALADTVAFERVAPGL